MGCGGSTKSTAKYETEATPVSAPTANGVQRQSSFKRSSTDLGPGAASKGLTRSSTTASLMGGDAGEKALIVRARRHSLSRLICHDFDIEENKVLGTGFAGPVLLCRSKKDGHENAVKSYQKNACTAKQIEMLKCEVEIYLRMDHPNIARLLDVYEDNLNLHMVMEFCAGGALYDRLLHRVIFMEFDAARSAGQMLRAINYLHGLNVVHCDLKLENWLYTSQEEDAAVKLIDFGFAKVWESGTATLRQDCGSILYCAPEVLAKDYTNGCDMWSLGVIVFMMLSGEPPFPAPQGKNGQKQTIDKIKKCDYSVSGANWWYTSEDAKDFIAKLIALSPKDRLSAREALDHAFIMQADDAAGGRRKLDVGTALRLRDFASAPPLRRAALCMMAHGLQSEEIADIHGIFDALDVDKSGSITLEGFVEIMKENLVISDMEVQRLFQVMDLECAGALSYTAFVAAMLQSRIKMGEDALKETFKKFDVSKSGFLTVDSLTEVLGNRESADEVMREVNCDSGIDLAHFIEAVSATTDTNQDLNRFAQGWENSKASDPGNLEGYDDFDAEAHVDHQRSMGHVSSVLSGARSQKPSIRHQSSLKVKYDATAEDTIIEGVETDRGAALEKFRNRLQECGIDLAGFGVGSAKSVEDLFLEVQCGESVMGHHLGVFKRMLTVLRIEVWAQTSQGERVLVHQDEELEDGRVRKGINERIAKKMSYGESLEDALYRTLGSELGLGWSWLRRHLSMDRADESMLERVSAGYPGICTLYRFKNIYMRVNDPLDAECQRIGLPDGADFTTEEPSAFGCNRRHTWGWHESLADDTIHQQSMEDGFQKEEFSFNEQA